jgi:hypothetical protein
MYRSGLFTINPILSGQSIEPSRGAMIVASALTEPCPAMDVAVDTLVLGT